MAQGMFRAAIALRQLGCTADPQAPFSTGARCCACWLRGRRGCVSPPGARRLPADTAQRPSPSLQPMLLSPLARLRAEAERYEQRFGCLDTLFRPELMPYEHFAAATDASTVAPARVLAAAQASFGGAAQRAAALLGAPQLRALLREEQARHLEGVQRTATANAVATKLLAATSARAAAAAAAGTEAGGAVAAAAPAFRATYDFKAALASSVASFYPTIVLKH